MNDLQERAKSLEGTLRAGQPFVLAEMAANLVRELIDRVAQLTEERDRLTNDLMDAELAAGAQRTVIDILRNDLAEARAALQRSAEVVKRWREAADSNEFLVSAGSGRTMVIQAEFYRWFAEDLERQLALASRPHEQEP